MVHILMRPSLGPEVGLCPRVICIVSPTADRASRGVVRNLTTGESRVEYFPDAGRQVSTILKVLRDRCEIARGVAPVWRRCKANAGSAQLQISGYQIQMAIDSQLYVSKTRVVDGCRLVSIDAREGPQVAIVT